MFDLLLFQRAFLAAPKTPLAKNKARGLSVKSLTVAPGVTIKPMDKMQPTACRVVTRTKINNAKLVY